MMRRWLLLLWVWLAWPAVAQGEMEVIALRHQTVEQVLPALLPLVEPGGTLTGMDDQLFLRASRRNREEIKRALAAIDVAARRLLIRVSSMRGAEESRRGEANGSVWDTRSARSGSGTQLVQTINGGRAWIQVGRSLPVPMRQVMIGPGGAVLTDAVVYRDIGQGFYAEPRVSGDRVTIEISQQANTPGRYGEVRTQRLATAVAGRLGEWIALGGNAAQADADNGGGFGASTGEIRDNRSLWLMVEEIRQ